MNLGWKLASTIPGDAPTDLLDSDEREWHSVGQTFSTGRGAGCIYAPHAEHSRLGPSSVILSKPAMAQAISLNVCWAYRCATTSATIIHGRAQRG